MEASVLDLISSMRGDDEDDKAMSILRGDGHDFAVKDLLNCTVELDGYRTTALIEACDIFINPNGTYTMRNGTSIHT